MNPVSTLSLLLLCIAMMGQSDGAVLKRNADSNEENLLKEILRGLDLSRTVYNKGLRDQYNLKDKKIRETLNKILPLVLLEEKLSALQYNGSAQTGRKNLLRSFKATTLKAIESVCNLIMETTSVEECTISEMINLFYFIHFLNERQRISQVIKDLKRTDGNNIDPCLWSHCKLFSNKKYLTRSSALEYIKGKLWPGRCGQDYLTYAGADSTKC
ncbi:PREDICTED: uncharacterized protein LOC109582169 [Amphimedon queenslandica]|uniref:DUF4371 domain-containing protein n=2 Tax=Amphimedon queenslandica TaxID=400682 RepID=A0AAN0J5S7_AMPQE|nr:PREDICTED: uncharacterized protein LOC109582169 [Amphimedon queenslandica]|eukprot:XP_019852375.1 PREDICTED: uncharacterized protein LOC109582169 [Amphimedon queenslandica]